MNWRRVERASLVGFTATLAFLACPAVSRAQPVDPGFDLFHTIPFTDSQFGPLMGVPLGTFDFGNGPQNTGNADTIVQRLSPGTDPPASQFFRIHLLALQLETQSPVNGHNFFIDLQSNRPQGGPGSFGGMTINFQTANPDPTAPQGTFDTANFNALFDVHMDSFNGPIVFSGSRNLDSTGSPWNHESPDPMAVEIGGVNDMLNMKDDSADFFFAGAILHSGPHPVQNAITPEPASIVLLGLGSLGLLGFWRRRR